MVEGKVGEKKDEVANSRLVENKDELLQIVQSEYRTGQIGCSVRRRLSRILYLL